MSSINQAVQHIIDANAPMVFTYAYSRPEFQRMVYPIGIVGDVVHTLDAETEKFKKFKLDGIVFPKPSNEKILSYALEKGSTFSFYYRNSNPEFKRVGVPVKFSKNGKAVLVKMDYYLPYRRWSNQTPNYTEHKYFTIDAMENLQPENYAQTLPERPTQEQSINFPDWIMNTDWSHGLEDGEINFDNEEPLEVELVDLGDGLSQYLRGGPVSDDENDDDYYECETTDEEYLPSSDDDEKSCSDDEILYEDEGVRVTKKMLEEEAAKIKKITARNKELKQVVDAIECIGCRHGIANQQAHYGGCIDYEEY